MDKQTLEFEILPQPNESSCGPTCLHAVYRYYGDDMPLEQVIEETRELKGGGTLDVFLGCHALRRGYKVTIYTYNLQVFDPTWFIDGRHELAERLLAQRQAKQDDKLHIATDGYLEFLSLGGILRFEDLTSTLMRRYLRRGIPILTGLSATFLYRSAREFGPKCEYDDVRGLPTGHFVVLCGYSKETREVRIADPLENNPMAPGQFYQTAISRAMGAILLGIVTYDANLLIIEPRRRRSSDT